MTTESSRFQHLLQPIRDLSLNWNIDLAQELEEYLDELEHLTIAFDPNSNGGEEEEQQNGFGLSQSSSQTPHLMNFAEAALLIQGTSLIYSRKVEYLYALVFQTLAHLSSQEAGVEDQDEEDENGNNEHSKRNKKNKKKKNQGEEDQDEEDHQSSIFHNPLPLYDVLEEAKSSTITRKKTLSSTSASASSAKTAADVERNKNNLQAAIALMGSLVPDERDGSHGETFKLLSCNLHVSGTLLLDETSKRFLSNENQVDNSNELTTTIVTDPTTAKLNFDHAAMASDDDEEDDTNDYVDMGGMDVEMDMEQQEETAEQPQETPQEPEAAAVEDVVPTEENNTQVDTRVDNQTNEEEQVEAFGRHPSHLRHRHIEQEEEEEEEANDPWKPLDPYDASENISQPFRKGRTFVKPRQLTKKKKNKKSLTNSNGLDDPLFQCKYLRPQRLQEDNWMDDLHFFEKNLKKKFCQQILLLKQCPLVWQLENKWLNLLKKIHAKEIASAKAILLEEQVAQQQVGQQQVGQQIRLEEIGPQQDPLVFDPVEMAALQQQHIEQNHPVDNDDDNHDDDDGLEPVDFDFGSSGSGMGIDGQEEEQQDLTVQVIVDDDRTVQSDTYEEICRQHIASFMKGTEKYIRETDLSKKVSDWQGKLAPILQEQDQHPPFDIHVCGQQIVQQLVQVTEENHQHLDQEDPIVQQEEKEEKEEKEEVIPFDQLVDGLPRYEVCRMFLASLQLANNGNVTLLHAKTAAEQPTIPFQMQLRSKTLRTVDNMMMMSSQSSSFSQSSQNQVHVLGA